MYIRRILIFYIETIRFCAIALDDSSIAILGGEYPTQDGIAISEEMKTYNIDNGEWSSQPSKSNFCNKVE